MENNFLLCIILPIRPIPSGLWIGKVFFNINLLRTRFETTNTFRILGTRQSGRFAVDFLMELLAALLSIIFGVSGISPEVGARKRNLRLVVL